MNHHERQQLRDEYDEHLQEMKHYVVDNLDEYLKTVRLRLHERVTALEQVVFANWEPTETEAE